MAQSADGAPGEIVTYSPLPYWGGGPGQTCVSILENMPDRLLKKTLVLPRLDHDVPASIEVKQAIPLLWRRLPYNFDRGVAALNRRYPKVIRSATPNRSIAYFWPQPPLSLIAQARKHGMVTVREMINTWLGTSKAVLDEAYARHSLHPDHGITTQRVEQETEELAHYDYIFASNPMVEESLVRAGIARDRILPSTFGWTPARFAHAKAEDGRDRPFRVLFVGIVGVRKGVPELLAAWRKCGVAGELVIAGPIEEAVRPMLQTHAESGSVKILNFVDDVGSLYRSSDIFVFPTVEEGGPQVTYEAAGCGLPVVTTPMGAARLVNEGVNGLVVAVGDVDGLAAAISQLAADPDRRKAMGRQAAIDAQRFSYAEVGADRAARLHALLRAHG